MQRHSSSTPQNLTWNLAQDNWPISQVEESQEIIIGQVLEIIN